MLAAFASETSPVSRRASENLPDPFPAFLKGAPPMAVYLKLSIPRLGNSEFKNPSLYKNCKNNHYNK
jgi:hypothetical protein